MKYVPLRSFEEVSSALNFASEGLQLVGGCDLYTTKAAGSDKKLYKQIDRSLEAQQEDVLRVAASLSPPQAARFAKTCNLAQTSPFGTLSQTSARRAFAYLVATLNASHPDYDFSHMQPSDFGREKRVRDVQRSVDANVYAAQAARRIPRGAQTPGGSAMWGPRMWDVVEAEMRLRQCECYSYRPEENPFDDEEMAVWSLHYFFFNKALKRVCYLYVRALTPATTGAPDDDVSSLAIEDLAAAVDDDDDDGYYERRRGNDDEEDDDEDEDDEKTTAPLSKRRLRPQSADFSARKRARYWLGDRAEALEREWAAADHPDDDGPGHLNVPSSAAATAAARQHDHHGHGAVDSDDGSEQLDEELLDQIARRGRSLSSSNLSEELAGEARRALVRRSGRVAAANGGDVARAVES